MKARLVSTLELVMDILVSKFAFTFNLYGYTEVVNPEVTKMPTTPKAPWGNRGVWADVDHVVGLCTS